MRNVIARIVAAVVIVVVIATSAGYAADRLLEKKLDSLFVIASSGEVRYRDMNEPAMDSIAAYGVDAVGFLIEKFHTRSARKRWTVIWTLQRIGSPAVPDLVQALGRPEETIVQRVCWALGDIKDTAAVMPLVGVAGHESWQVRDQAVTALGQIGDDRGAEAVVAAFADTIGQVRKSAVVACRKLELPGHERELIHMLGDEFYGARLAAFEALLSMDTTFIVNVLHDSLNSSNRFVAYLGCDLLGRFGGDQALTLLFEQTHLPDSELRAHAAVAIITADPKDLCSFHERLLASETDYLTRLKIESALQSSTAGE